MAKHNIFFELPSVELGKVDAKFHIKKDGKQFGTITISKGDLEWYPYKAKKPYKISWTALDKLVRGQYDDE
jgi:hypothetical protein